MLIKLFVFLRKICRCKPAVLFFFHSGNCSLQFEDEWLPTWLFSSWKLSQRTMFGKQRSGFKRRPYTFWRTLDFFINFYEKLQCLTTKSFTFAFSQTFWAKFDLFPTISSATVWLASFMQNFGKSSKNVPISNENISLEIFINLKTFDSTQWNTYMHLV